MVESTPKNADRKHVGFFNCAPKHEMHFIWRQIVESSILGDKKSQTESNHAIGRRIFGSARK